MITPCKVIQDSLGFRIPRCGFRLQCLWFRIPNVVGFQTSKFYFGFLMLLAGFRIPLAGLRISKPWISDSTDKTTWIPDSELPYMGRNIAQPVYKTGFVARSSLLTSASKMHLSSKLRLLEFCWVYWVRRGLHWTALVVILTTLTRDIQCESSLRMRQSVIWCNGSNPNPNNGSKTKSWQVLIKWKIQLQICNQPI